MGENQESALELSIRGRIHTETYKMLPLTESITGNSTVVLYLISTNSLIEVAEILLLGLSVMF